MGTYSEKLQALDFYLVILVLRSGFPPSDQAFTSHFQSSARHIYFSPNMGLCPGKIQVRHFLTKVAVLSIWYPLVLATVICRHF